MMPSRTAICLVAIALVLFNALMSVFSLTANYREQHKLTRYLDEQAVQERLGGVFSAMNDFPGSAGKDMLFLRSLSSIRAFVDSGSGEARVADDLRQFLMRNAAYVGFFVHDGAQACVLSERGGPVDGVCACAGADTSGEIATAAKAASVLPVGSVYVSKLIPLACASGEPPIAAILYATHIDAPGGGTLTTAVDANYFLEEIRRLSRQGESVYLLRGDGAYLAHRERSKEWVYGGTANFYTDYVQVPEGVLTDPAVHRLERQGKTFTFLRITPTISNFALYDSETSESGEYWIMVAVSDTAEGSAWWLSVSYLIAATMIVLIHALLAIMMGMILLPQERKQV